MKRQYSTMMLIAFGLLVSTFFIALLNGAATIRVNELIGLFTGSVDNSQTLILKEIRLPRVLAAGLAGMALSVAGAYMQGMTGNPLASPSLFGITAGASAALSFSLAFFEHITHIGVLMACLLGSVISGLLVFLILMSGKHGLSNNKTILAGAAVSTMLYAISDAIALRFSTSKQMTMWASSGLVGITYKEILLVLPIIVVGSIVAVHLSRKLTLVSLNDEVALSLGENTKILRICFFILVTCLTGAAVALSGSIVFVGLVVPHIVKKFVGGDYQVIVPFCLIGGASFLFITDTVARVINAPYETPLTAVMAVASYPVFLYVVKKGDRLI